VTFVPLACVAMAGLGLVLGTSFEPRNIGLMFGFIILPITFLGGTYYTWTKLAPVTISGWHWLQTIVLPIASVVHAPGVQAHITLHWWIIVTVVPLACIAMAGLGLVLGTSFEPRNIGLMFGFIILPITFLGGTYYSWTKLAPVTVGGWHWLQTLVLINPLIYVNEGMRAAFTDAPHMPLYVIYPVVAGFGAVFLAIGLRNFRRRVLS